MTKLKEHAIRWFEHLPKRLWASLIAISALGGTLMALYFALNIIFVTDSYGNRKMLVTPTTDPVELMNLSGIVADEHDNYYYTAYNGNVANLNIQRAFPVTVQADGKTNVIYMTSGTVEDAVAQTTVVLGEHDYTEPSLNTEVADGTQIVVHRVEYRDTVTQSEIPFETDYHYTSLLHRYRNRTYVMQEGVNGIEETTYRERLVDGVVQSSQIVSVETTLAPVNQVVLAYGAGAPVSSIESVPGVEIVNNVPTSYRSVITNARCSAYSASRGRGASGLGLYAGTVAVNPNVIPYGSVLYITSADGSFVYGFAIATDTGGALMDGTVDVDLFYDSYLESVLNGVKYLNVYVI